MVEKSMKQRVFIVTGAAGFLGSNVCRQLVKRGEKVRAFVVPNDKGTKYLPKEVEIIEGDLCNKESLDRLFDIPNDQTIEVIHCASIVTVDPAYNPTVMKVNVDGTKNIIEQCSARKNFGKLVYVSSTGCIPELPHGQAIKEIRYFSTESLMDCYSQSKALATQAVLDAATNGLDACVVHPGGILGPEDYAIGHTTKTLIQIIKGEMSAAIDGTFNLCDVRDLANGIIAAVDRGRSGECYILANDAVSFRDFAKLISEESGCKRMKLFLPGKLAYFLAEMIEKRAKKSGKKPLMTTYAVYNLIRNNVFDSSKARRELGYSTRSYRETIRDEINWLKSIGELS